MKAVLGEGWRRRRKRRGKRRRRRMKRRKRRMKRRRRRKRISQHSFSVMGSKAHKF